MYHLLSFEDFIITQEKRISFNYSATKIDLSYYPSDILIQFIELNKIPQIFGLNLSLKQLKFAGDFYTVLWQSG